MQANFTLLFAYSRNNRLTTTMRLDHLTNSVPTFLGNEQEVYWLYFFLSLGRFQDGTMHYSFGSFDVAKTLIKIRLALLASRSPLSNDLNDGDKDDGDEIVVEGDEEAPAIGQDTFDTWDELQACVAQYRARVTLVATRKHHIPVEMRVPRHDSSVLLVLQQAVGFTHGGKKRSWASMTNVNTHDKICAGLDAKHSRHVYNRVCKKAIQEEDLKTTSATMKHPDIVRNMNHLDHFQTSITRNNHFSLFPFVTVFFLLLVGIHLFR
ncbi:hypothetical protein PsorP6_011387 [Peronosclerospora sorghi]|uniref:Uncharacterized protein n=1 Tax=Peronosclerospora sorghi TaxID=230839 RepID=A0ACC0WIC8_9STRA|nr:hypothetical protein PsorP6_011387 [Peronosclerospora sorghi]